MARKKKHEEHENHERWLVSYADFITLLFAFFVVMYSISSVNEGKYRVLSDSLIAAFKASPKSMEPIQIGKDAKSSDDKAKSAIIMPKVPVPQLGKGENASSQTLNRMASKIEHAMSELIAKGLVSVKRGNLWLEVEINTNILFPSGSANLQDEAKPVLSEISKILRDFKNPIRVEGFTDNKPINTIVFPSNWELSSARSASVVHLFMNNGISPERMAAVGYGEYRPFQDNATEDGRNKNRKVVIVILNNYEIERVYSEMNQINKRDTEENGLVSSDLDKPLSSKPPSSDQ
ncbi:MAG: flagellar motor protein MotD [Pseudomonadota bacterium]